MISIARIFGAPVTVPAGKHDAERVEAIETVAQPRTQTRLQMLHVRIRFDRHQIFDLHRAVIGNTSEIVAAEIDEHHVLRDFLLVGFQILAQHPVFGFGRAAFARAGDRAIVESLAVTTHEHFRRRADHCFFTRAQEKHVRRRIDRAKCAIDLQRLASELGRKPLRQHGLITIAGGNVLLDTPHAVFESAPGPV